MPGTRDKNGCHDIAWLVTMYDVHYIYLILAYCSVLHDVEYLTYVTFIMVDMVQKPATWTGYAVSDSCLVRTA